MTVITINEDTVHSTMPSVMDSAPITADILQKNEVEVRYIQTRMKRFLMMTLRASIRTFERQSRPAVADGKTLMGTCTCNAPRIGIHVDQRSHGK